MKARIEFEKIVNYPIIPPNVPRCPEWPDFVGKGLEKRSPEEQAMFGFKTVAEPEITEYQHYGKVLEDGNGGFVYEVKERVLPTLEELQAQHRNELVFVIREISTITSAVKNIYDPLRTGETPFPDEFKALVGQILPMRDIAIAQINALATVEESQNYSVRGPMVDGFLQQLNSLL